MKKKWRKKRRLFLPGIWAYKESFPICKVVPDMLEISNKSDYK
jgi:hypothetical protein